MLSTSHLSRFPSLFFATTITADTPSMLYITDSHTIRIKADIIGM